MMQSFLFRSHDKIFNFRYQPAKTGTYPELDNSLIKFNQVWLEFS